MKRQAAIAGLLMLVASPVLVRAQTPVNRPHDGIQAGLDAYRLAEVRRRGNLQQQLDVNEGLRAWSGQPPLYGDTIWYRDAAGFGPATPREAWYATGAGYGYGPNPWSLVSGPGWDASYATPYRQPVGRWEGQTGPNRWESHPVYDPPLTLYRPSPPVDSPWLDRTPYAAPRPEIYLPNDEYSAATDAELPPPPPATTVMDPSPTVPEPLDELADEFDTPRRVRGPAEALVPPPAPTPAPRRVREF